MPSLSDMVTASTQALVTLRKKTIDHVAGGKSLAKRASRGSIISLQHYDNLVNELRCPSCTSPMCAPIRLCKTGHSVCDLCARMLQRCPLCSKPFTDTRSIALEAVASKAEFNCSNVQLGCPARLTLKMLRQHEPRCVYQMGDCFMGRVWGKCEWRGREMDWLEHCESEHADRMFFDREVTIQWQGTYELKPKPISAYYIFRTMGESFNMYQLLDKRMQRISWTLICASKDTSISKRFAYEVELFVPNNPSRLLMKRQPVHGELDDDVLLEGRGAAFDMKEAHSYMDAYRVLHYRVRVLQIPSEVPSPSTRRVAAIREAKEAFLGVTSSNTTPPAAEDPSSMTSSIVVAEIDGNGSSSSFEHVEDREKTPPKTNVDLNVFEKEFPIGETSELRSPALLSRFNSIPKPPRHSLDRSVTAADVAAMQPLLTSDQEPNNNNNDDGSEVPVPPTTPMPKDEKSVAFAKTIVD